MGSLGRGFRWASPSGSGRHEKVPAGGVSGVGLRQEGGPECWDTGWGPPSLPLAELDATLDGREQAGGTCCHPSRNILEASSSVGEMTCQWAWGTKTQKW